MTSFHAPTRGRCSHVLPNRWKMFQLFLPVMLINGLFFLLWLRLGDSVENTAGTNTLRGLHVCLWERTSARVTASRPYTGCESAPTARVWETLGSLLYGRRHGNSNVHRRNIDSSRQGETIKCHLRFHYGSGPVNPNFNAD